MSGDDSDLAAGAQPFDAPPPAQTAGGAMISASAPSLSPLDGANTHAPAVMSIITALDPEPEMLRGAALEPAPPSSAPAPASASASKFTFKRRATSCSEQLPLRSPASSARTAVASAFASVSSATSGRFLKFRSLSSDNFMKKSNSAAASTTATATGTVRGPPLSAPMSAPNLTAWKANMNDFARRAREAAMRAKSGVKYSWDGDESGSATATVQYVSGVFEYHGEDAGAVSSYFHIVADGVSSPFGRQSLANITHEPASSELIAKELVRAVQQALKDVTNQNTTAIDLKTFESVVVDAIKATRIKCFPHRQSRIAATLSVSYFDRWSGKLLTFSLGDSKCVVVRNGEIAFETPAVLRDFNMPTVVNLSHQVASSDYVLQSFALQENDVCMTFSDGIGDNLYKDDITSAVKSAQLDDRAALQRLCDELVYQSQMKISVERAQELLAANDLKKLHDLHDQLSASSTSNTSGSSSGSSSPDCENECLNARISIHNAPVRGLFPFATAAALEYRARALEECSADPVADGDASSSQDAAAAANHLACSLALFEKHKHKQTLGRQQLVRKPTQRNKRHYNLLQLKRMAEMQTKKPDDITLFVTHFR